MSSQGFFCSENVKTFWHCCSSSPGLPCLTTFQSSHPLVFCVISQLLVLLSTLICQHIWKTQQWPQDQKRSVFIPRSKKGNAKECSNYCTIALISHATKVMFKILQARIQQQVNSKLLDVQAGFRKGRRTRDQIANICWIIEKAREFQKNIYFCFIDYAKAFDCGSQQTVENS